MKKFSCKSMIKSSLEVVDVEAVFFDAKSITYFSKTKHKYVMSPFSDVLWMSLDNNWRPRQN